MQEVVSDQRMRIAPLPWPSRLHHAAAREMMSLQNPAVQHKDEEGKHEKIRVEAGGDPCSLMKFA